MLPRATPTTANKVKSRRTLKPPNIACNQPQSRIYRNDGTFAKLISNAIDRLHITGLGRVWFNLLAQVHDMNIHGALQTAIIIAKGSFEQVQARKYPLRLANQD